MMCEYSCYLLPDGKTACSTENLNDLSSFSEITVCLFPFLQLLEHLFFSQNNHNSVLSFKNFNIGFFNHSFILRQGLNCVALAFHVNHAGLKFIKIYLPFSPECWDYRRVPDWVF